MSSDRGATDNSDDTGAVPTEGEGLRMSEREVAQLISRIERGDAGAVQHLFTVDSSDTAFVVGVTGPPGSGKSTLVDVLARQMRLSGQTVAVLAIDPSSHLTGGAMLGDRVRMSSHSQDPGIYIRSMATRGCTSGLARATRDSVKVLEAAGYDVIIVETVGVGQVELDVLTVADAVAVVLVPGLGDTMQMNKAGIMEIGDLFVVNMADRPETAGFVRELKQALALGFRHDDIPPVCQTVALSGDGVDQLWKTLSDRDTRDRRTGRREERRREQRTDELRREIESRVLIMARAIMRRSPELRAAEEQVAEGRKPATAAAKEWMVGRSLTAG